MTTDLLQEAVALLRALADHNVTYWSDDGEARFNPGKNQADSMRIFREARAFLAKIDAMPAGDKLPDEVLIWDVENCEEGPFTSEHDYLIAMTELSGEEDLIGMSFRCTMAAQLPSKELTITAVCPVTGNPTEWTETLLAASQRHGGE